MARAAPKTGIKLANIAERLTPTTKTAEFHKQVGIRVVISAKIVTHMMVVQFVGTVL